MELEDRKLIHILLLWSNVIFVRPHQFDFMVHGIAKSRHKTQSARIKSRGCWCWSDVISIIEANACS